MEKLVAFKAFVENNADVYTASVDLSPKRYEKSANFAKPVENHDNASATSKYFSISLSDMKTRYV